MIRWTLGLAVILLAALALTYGYSLGINYVNNLYYH